MHSIAAWLINFPELQSVAERNQNLDSKMQDAVSRIERLYVRGESPKNPEGICTRWTSVTRKQPFVDHLMELYFLWIHPNCMLFSETNFLDCYFSGDDTYCSTALVNAICAMACHLLVTPRDASPQITSDHASLAAAFIAEARSQIHPSEPPRITTLQAFAVMFLVELSSGRARNAATYLRCAADNLQDLEDDGHKDEVFEATRWGIHTLNT